MAKAANFIVNLVYYATITVAILIVVFLVTLYSLIAYSHYR